MTKDKLRNIEFITKFEFELIHFAAVGFVIVAAEMQNAVKD